MFDYIVSTYAISKLNKNTDKLQNIGEVEKELQEKNTPRKQLYNI